MARRRRLERARAEAARAAAERARLEDALAQVDAQLRAHRVPLADAVAVRTPCRVRWEEMRGDDVVRRCTRCGRDVHDPSRMTRDEIAALLSRAARTPCVRLRRRPDGRVVTADCPAPRPGAAARGLRGAAAGLLLGASAGGAAALATARPVPAVPPPATAAADGLDLTPRVEREALRSSALEEPPEETEGTEEREVALLGKPAAPLFPPASADLARGIRRTGPREWTIDPALVEAALLRLELWGVRPIPHEANGRVQSVRLYGIRPKSPLGRLGFQNGDGVVAVNGVPVEDLAAAVRLLAPLRRTDVLRVRLERRGEERVHVYRSRVVAQEGAGSASGSGDGGAASSSRVSFQSSRRP